MEQSTKSAKFGLLVDNDNRLYEVMLTIENGKTFLRVKGEDGINRKCVPIYPDQVEAFRRCKIWKHEGIFLYGYRKDDKDKNDPLWIMVDNIRRGTVLISVDGWKTGPIQHPGGIADRKYVSL